MKKNKLVKKGTSLIIVVLAVKLIGFLKQSVIAWKFGTLPVLDSYFAADGFVSMIGQIVLASIPPAIITLYLKIREKSKRDNFICSTFLFLTAVGLMGAIIVVFMAPLLAKMLGVSFDGGQISELSKFIIILSPLILFACISSVSSGLLQAKNIFIPEKLLGLFLSVGIILSVFLFAPKIGINSLLIGFMIGYCIYFIMMFVLLIKNSRIKIVNPMRDPAFAKFLRIVIPIVVGVSIVDLSHLIDRIIASSLASGSVSSLYYSQIISGDLINGVVIASIGMVLLPKLSTDAQNKTKLEVLNSLKKIMGVVTPVILVITAIYLMIGENLVSVAFQRGEFTYESTIAVSNCVVGYAVGFIFILVKELFIKYFYAQEDTSTPMMANIVGIVVNIVLSLFLSSRIGVQGIAYATSFSYLVSDLVLFRKIRLDVGGGCRYAKWNVGRELGKNILILAISVMSGMAIRSIPISNNVLSVFAVSLPMILTFGAGSLLLKTTFGRLLAYGIHKIIFRRYSK